MKKLYLTLLIVLSVFMFNSSVYAKAVTDSSSFHNADVLNISSGLNVVNVAKEKTFLFCDQASVLRTLKIIHLIITIAKIAVPIILIVIGSIEYGKAAIGDDAEGLEKTTHSLIKKVVAGLFVFLIPTVVDAVMSLSYKNDDYNSKNDNLKCIRCFSGDKSCDGLIDWAVRNED